MATTGTGWGTAEPGGRPGAPGPAWVAAPPAARTNGLAVAGFVLGLLWVLWVGSVLAVVFGHLAREQIDRSGGAQRGRGLATAALVLGWAGLGVLAVGLAVALVAVLAA